MGITITRTRAKPVAVRTATRRVTRPVVSKQAGVDPATAKEKIDELLQTVAKVDAAIDLAVAQKDKAYKQIEELMRSANLSKHSNGVYDPEIYEAFSRQQRTIKPQKFRNAVTNDVFWECVDVNITRASKHLTEQEINDLSDIVPSKSEGFQFRIKAKKKK